MNQIIAMLFPLLGLVAAGTVALALRKPWRSRKAVTVQAQPATPRPDITEAMRQARAALENVETIAHRATENLSRTLVP